MPRQPPTQRRASARERGYNTRWERDRADFLTDPDHQFCVKCLERGILNNGMFRMDGSAQTNPRRMHLVVDHIIPHKGDQRLFWDRTNWQPLCPDDHDIIKQREEHGQEAGGVDVKGRPTSADHPWNRRA